MTDPLIEVAEQMERFADSGAGHLTPSAVGQIAARIRAFWTPERKAFYEASAEWNLIREELSKLPPEPWQAINAKTILLSQAEKVMRERYRALVESERGESEGR